jgi:Type VI secretion system, TssF
MFDARHFSKENTRNRLLKRAAELWGLDDSALDSFDPLVRLLLEACSVEFEKLGRDIQATETRLMERLAQILCPDVANLPQPASAIATFRPVEARAVVLPETALVFQKSGANKINEANEFYFSPAVKTTVLNASVRVLVNPNTIYQIENGNQRTVFAEASTAVSAGERWLWIGVEINQSVKDIQGLMFFFDWALDTHRATYCEFLPLAHWSLANKTIETYAGRSNDSMTDTELSIVENQVMSLWDKHFVSVKNTTLIDANYTPTSLYPSELEARFGWQPLQTLQQQLHWFKVEFPQSFPMEAFESLTVALNAVPVLNRRLHKLNYRLQQGINSVPLLSDEAFLAVQTVWNQSNQKYTDSEEAQELGKNNRSFTLRQQGVGRFDARQATELLYYVTETIRDERMAFSAIGEEFLSALIRELSQNLAKLEQKLGTQKTTQTTSKPFLMVRTDQKTDNVFVSFWTTLAEQANLILAGSKLKAYSGSDLNNNELFLLTRPFGGRPRLNGSEYVAQLKKNLLTHNRLVTLEDIRVFCLAELGNKVQKVEIKRHFMMNSIPNKGIMRCLQVLLVPQNTQIDIQSWQYICDSLKTQIETNSTAHLPVQVLLNVEV